MNNVEEHHEHCKNIMHQNNLKNVNKKHDPWYDETNHSGRGSGRQTSENIPGRDVQRGWDASDGHTSTLRSKYWVTGWALHLLPASSEHHEVRPTERGSFQGLPDPIAFAKYLPVEYLLSSGTHSGTFGYAATGCPSGGWSPWSGTSFVRAGWTQTTRLLKLWVRGSSNSDNSTYCVSGNSHINPPEIQETKQQHIRVSNRAWSVVVSGMVFGTTKTGTKPKMPGIPNVSGWSFLWWVY